MSTHKKPRLKGGITVNQAIKPSKAPVTMPNDLVTKADILVLQQRADRLKTDYENALADLAQAKVVYGNQTQKRPFRAKMRPEVIKKND